MTINTKLLSIGFCGIGKIETLTHLGIVVGGRDMIHKRPSATHGAHVPMQQRIYDLLSFENIPLSEAIFKCREAQLMDDKRYMEAYGIKENTKEQDDLIRITGGLSEYSTTQLKKELRRRKANK